MKGELDRTKAELTDYKVEDEEWRAQEKKAFLELEEFFNILGSCSSIMFEYGLWSYPTIQRGRLPSEGAPSDFLKLSKPLDNLPEEAPFVFLFLCL